MKFLKYAILSLLVITVCKKITPQSKASLQKEKRKSLSSNITKYDDTRKLATVAKTTFVAVYEYDPATSNISPHQIVPAMVPFGTIHSKIDAKKFHKYQHLGDKFQSRYKDIISLYGIPVDGYRKPIRKAHTHKIIAHLWENQDQIKGEEYGLGIAQLHSGETYVGVKPVHLPNYIDKPHESRYSPQELELLKHRYGIKANNPVLIGTCQLGTMKYSGPYKRQKYVLYGIKLPNIQEENNKLTAYPFIAYHVIQKFLANKANNYQTTDLLSTEEPIPHRTAASAFFEPLF
jgi:hypothetical protein